MKVTGNDNEKHRQLHMEDYLQMVSVEQREYAKVCGSPRITENSITDTNKQTEGLLKQILTSENLNRAYKQVKRNKGAGGIDGMQVDELLPFLKENQKTGNTNRRGQADSTSNHRSPDTNSQIPECRGDDWWNVRGQPGRSAQGGPLSPLLGNIMLNECDKELEKRGHRFVHYADDLMVFCQSKKAAQRTLDRILSYIEEILFLKVNREKTKVSHVKSVKYLGHDFYIYKGEGRLRIHPKSIQKLKDKIREITRISNGMGIQERKDRLNQVVRGWTNYFKLVDARNLLIGLDEWLRSRIRMVTWKRRIPNYTYGAVGGRPPS